MYLPFTHKTFTIKTANWDFFASSSSRCLANDCEGCVSHKTLAGWLRCLLEITKRFEQNQTAWALKWPRREGTNNVNEHLQFGDRQSDNWWCMTWGCLLLLPVQWLHKSPISYLSSLSHPHSNSSITLLDVLELNASSFIALNASQVWSLPFINISFLASYHHPLDTLIARIIQSIR